MINFWYRANGHFVPRTKELLSPSSITQRNAGKRHAAVPRRTAEERWQLGERIADQTKGAWLFQWESAPQVMTE